MSNDSYPAGRVPLRGPGVTEPDWGGDPAAPRGTRREGINRARWMSNWTAAALITGTGAAVIALAHNAVPAAAPVAAPAAGAAGAAPAATGSPAAGSGAKTHSGAAGGAVAASQGAPPASHSVATTSASGVTSVTTTNPVTGQKTVTKVRHGGSGSDN